MNQKDLNNRDDIINEIRSIEDCVWRFNKIMEQRIQELKERLSDA